MDIIGPEEIFFVFVVVVVVTNLMSRRVQLIVTYKLSNSLSATLILMSAK